MKIVERKPKKASPDRNAGFQMRWVDLAKEIIRNRKSGLDTGREKFEKKRKSFAQGNSMRRRTFERKTEKLLESCLKDVLDTGIVKDGKRREKNDRII